MMFVSTEESAQGQGPQESDPVQHANAPEERQAKGEVRVFQRSANRKCSAVCKCFVVTVDPVLLCWM